MQAKGSRGTHDSCWGSDGNSLSTFGYQCIETIEVCAIWQRFGTDDKEL